MQTKKRGDFTMPEKGIVIEFINEGSEAERVGLNIGDILLKYDDLFLNGDFSYLKSLCETNAKRANVDLVIIRENIQKTIIVQGGDLGINEPGKKAKTSAQSVMTSHSTNSNVEINTDYKFRTLLGYAKFVAAFGWGIAIIGVVLILIGFNNIESTGFFAIFGGIITLAMGIGLVANGQLISCFVSIERNTRKTNELLTKK